MFEDMRFNKNKVIEIWKYRDVLYKYIGRERKQFAESYIFISFVTYKLINRF
jgi:hypothetical protein